MIWPLLSSLALSLTTVLITCPYALVKLNVRSWSTLLSSISGPLYLLCPRVKEWLPHLCLIKSDSLLPRWRQFTLGSLSWSQDLSEALSSAGQHLPEPLSHTPNVLWLLVGWSRPQCVNSEKSGSGLVWFTDASPACSIKPAHSRCTINIYWIYKRK